MSAFRAANGPRLLFFSGGTALRGLCRSLTPHSHRTIHLVTPFDSGGSSAGLRETFAIPAVGDVRNRLLSLCDDGTEPAERTIALLGHRLPSDRPQVDLERIVDELVAGRHPLMIAAPVSAAAAASTYLHRFRRDMPPVFQLAGASVGNLIIVGAILQYGGFIAAIDAVAAAVGARGVVRPIVAENLHIAARLADGRCVVGQHLLTGKENPALGVGIEDIWLVDDLDGRTCVPPVAAKDTLTIIENADLLCLPIGSFWTSVAVNLLPSGVGEAMARAKCAKVYVPNPGHDPEMVGLSVLSAATKLNTLAMRDCATEAMTTDHLLIDTVIVDSTNGLYPSGLDVSALHAAGYKVIDVDFVLGGDRIRPRRLAVELLKLAGDSREV